MASSPASDRPRRRGVIRRPPRVERVLAAARSRLDARTDPGALLAVARAVVDDERGRLEAGRSPASVEDLAGETTGRLAAMDAAGSYVLLEMDRATGRRGVRARKAEDHLVALTGSEDALVTNNNA